MHRSRGGSVQQDMIQGKAVTIQEVFTARQYRLDSYQRDYTWGREDIRRLIDDLRAKFMTNWSLEHDREDVSRYSPYFLGPYVYHEDAHITFLVDGQQRITTLHLMLVYLRELLLAQDLEGEAAHLSSLIQSRKFGKPVYTLDIPDRGPFLEQVFSAQDYALPDNAPGDLRRLWEGARVLQEEFPEELRGDALPYFVDWLLDGVCMVGIRAATSEQGWEIYESMNDRGVRLGPIDLLKSFLLSRIGGEKGGVDKIWRQMVSELAGIDANAPSEFIKTFLISRYADVSMEPGDNPTDVERINGPFHAWVKDNVERLDLHKSSDFRGLVDDLAKYSERFRTLAAASNAYDRELQSVFFNAYNGIKSQAAPILAAVEPKDDSASFKTKAQLIADYLDLLFARRIVNDLPSSGLDSYAVRLVERVRGGVSVDKLRTILAEEVSALDYDFKNMKAYGLRSNNSGQVRYLLARLTGFVQTSCGLTDDMAAYLDTSRPFEIEHIWANHFERYQPETNTRAMFDAYRNRLGALLLLRKSDNASYQDLPYEKKVVYYQRQNQIAGSLHTGHRERNPTFNRFAKQYKLDRLLRAFAKFDKKAIDERQALYQRLCELIWDPTTFGTLPTAAARRPDPSRTRTRARYDVSVADLITKGLLPADAELIGQRRGERFQAQVLADGRIQVASGETFRSLSGAGEFVLQTKACPGWNFWQTQLDGRLVRLIDIRRDALEKGLV
ncbi:DUF262 domain-containing protein [Kribbella hippodromi]|uniref:DUF262 domain-containing protein n=1 Tax=Kribbella hippodromi TaxID=434347 RepID=A0ABN2EGL8_9ACTN